MGRAAQAADLPFQGGPIGSGREFNADFFDLRGADVVFRDEEAERRYRGFLTALDAKGLDDLRVPLVATLGLSPHTLATTEYWRIYRDRGGAFAPGFLSSGLFADIVRAMVRGALAFYAHALGLGLRVLAVLPPQRVPGMSDPDVFLAAQEAVHGELDHLGVEVVDLRSRVTDASGFQRPAFCEADDTIHGNLAFGRLIVHDLLARGL
ncbi:hypothetical protein [Streptomyces sp. NBC_00878]|uniref:hypothetical protein n=1 Tax=Streptomyces sp. NBC_00878 TaxID=2975854 RepID=UPI00225399F2|nr:hypothetical protein [Streptomyces sp. NBC_00878]MCX4903724.1 hypothetical protein [Streptomyces sp. NBC_00878]